MSTTTPKPFGHVSAPDGRSGPWSINTFTLTDDQVMMANLRAIRDGHHERICPPGTYRRLVHEDRGVVMSNTPMEIQTAWEAIEGATGNVLVNGLGLGMLIEGMLAKPDVTRIRVIELDQHVINLVGRSLTIDPRVHIVCADAFTYRPAPGEVFDYVWHDIWDQIDADNLPEMARLTRKYARPRSKAQGVWSRDLCRREQRRYG